MNIKRAKQEIKQAVAAYLEKDDEGLYRIPPVHQRPILLMGPPGIGKTQIMEQIPEPPEREESIRYFVAESMAFPVMGAYSETDSLDEAKRLYDALPETPSNHDRGIGAILEQKNGKQSDVPLFVEGEIKTEHLENSLFAESVPLKEAFSNLEKMVSNKTIEKSKNVIGDMER